MSQPVHFARLVTFLGKAAYQPTAYQSPYDAQQTFPTQYVAAALAEFLRPDEVVVLATDDAWEVHGGQFTAQLCDHQGLTPQRIVFPAGRSEGELWAQFEILKEALRVPNSSAPGRVALDITLGFRSAPFFCAGVVSFLQLVDERPPEVSIYYGAFDARQENSTPIWDLTAFTELIQWSSHIMLLLKTGRAEGLAEATESIGRALTKEWAMSGKRGTAPNLRELAEALGRLGGDLETVRTGALLLGDERRKSSVAALHAELLASQPTAFAIPLQLEEALVKLKQLVAALRSENEALRASYEARQRDYAALNTQYLTLAQSINSVIAERDVLKQQVAELEAPNRKLTDMLWGRRSERRLDASMSLLLDFGDDLRSLSTASTEVLGPEVIAASAAAQAVYDSAKLAELEARRKARKARQEGQASRDAFPAHLERREVVMDLPEEQKVGLKPIGTKIFERMRFEKPTVYIERIVRHLYVNNDVVDPASSPVIAAPTLPTIVEGCKYDFSIIAAIVSMKFAFHMSTYREQDFFGQSGWHPSRSTCNDLINFAVGCVDPLFAQMSACLMHQPIVFGDATVLTVLLRVPLSQDDQQTLDQREKNRHQELAAKLKAKRSKGSSGTKAQDGSATSYAWLYSGQDAPNELLPDSSVPRPERPPPIFDDPVWRYAPYNIFHWSLTQKHSVIDGHLANFQGIFVGDAAGANANLAARSGQRIAHQSCNAHARRYFVKAQSNDPVLASQMAALY